MRIEPKDMKLVQSSLETSLSRSLSLAFGVDPNNAEFRFDMGLPLRAMYISRAEENMLIWVLIAFLSFVTLFSI